MFLFGAQYLKEEFSQLQRKINMQAHQQRLQRRIKFQAQTMTQIYLHIPIMKVMIAN